ncbi:MAG: FAD-dependent oxidoreductase [Pseudomonadota bacterium]
MATQKASSGEHKPPIAILGAGLMGRMLAISLMDDYQVFLFDKDDKEGQCSAAYLAAAMLAPLAESADCSREIMQLGEMALDLWPDFLKRLDTPVFFQQKGSLIVSFEQDKSDLKQFKSRLKGIDYKVVYDAELDELEPGLNHCFKSALYLPNEGQLDNRQLLNAMATALNKSDVQWFESTAVESTSNGFQVAGEPLESFLNEKLNLKTHAQFDWIFDCRGLGTQADTALNKESIDHSKASKLRGVRGEVVRLRAPGVDLTRPVRLMHPRYPIYIAPKGDGLFVVGATQIESEDSRNPTVRSTLELLSACFSVHSGFAEAEILGIESGLRPAYLDNEPKIIVKERQVCVNGLFRHGYLLAPVILQQCLNIIQGNVSDISITQLMPKLVEELRAKQRR